MKTEAFPCFQRKAKIGPKVKLNAGVDAAIRYASPKERQYVHSLTLVLHVMCSPAKQKSLLVTIITINKNYNTFQTKRCPVAFHFIYLFHICAE